MQDYVMLVTAEDYWLQREEVKGSNCAGRKLHSVAETEECLPALGPGGTLGNAKKSTDQSGSPLLQPGAAPPSPNLHLLLLCVSSLPPALLRTFLPVCSFGYTHSSSLCIACSLLHPSCWQVEEDVEMKSICTWKCSAFTIAA